MTTSQQPITGEDAAADAVRKRRRVIIEMCQRRQRPGTGSALELLATKSPTIRWPDLIGPLEGIPWAVVGAVGTRKYMPERRTRTLDIVVVAEDAAEVRRRLAGDGYECREGRSHAVWRRRASTRQDIRVLEGREPWWADALAQAAENRDPHGLPVLPLPYLVLTKLRAGRVQDVADVTRMVGLADDAALERVRSFVAQESPGD